MDRKCFKEAFDKMSHEVRERRDKHVAVRHVGSLIEQASYRHSIEAFQTTAMVSVVITLIAAAATAVILRRT